MTLCSLFATLGLLELAMPPRAAHAKSQEGVGKTTRSKTGVGTAVQSKAGVGKTTRPAAGDIAKKPATKAARDRAEYLRHWRAKRQEAVTVPVGSARPFPLFFQHWNEENP